MSQHSNNLKSSGTTTKANQSNKYITLKSLRNLRSWFRDASSQDINDVIKQLEHLRREKIKQEEEDNIRNLRFKEMWEHYAAQGYSARMYLGLDPQEVLNALTDHLSCRLRHIHSARVKYRYHDLDGNLCEWSGQGREPRKLKELLEATGKNRDDFLVKNEQLNDAFLTQEAFVRLSESIDHKQSLFQKAELHRPKRKENKQPIELAEKLA